MAELMVVVVWEWVVAILSSSTTRSNLMAATPVTAPLWATVLNLIMVVVTADRVDMAATEVVPVTVLQEAALVVAWEVAAGREAEEVWAWPEAPLLVPVQVCSVVLCWRTHSIMMSKKLIRTVSRTVPILMVVTTVVVMTRHQVMPCKFVRERYLG
jgi:hypothetical protein